MHSVSVIPSFFLLLNSWLIHTYIVFLIKTKKKVIAASRRQLLEVGSTRTYLHSRTNTSNNATTVDSTTPHGNKITLIFCITKLCRGFRVCYCCMNQKPEPDCYKTMEQCRSVCPTCNPKCPPQPSLHLAMKGWLMNSQPHTNPNNGGHVHLAGINPNN